MILLHPHSSRLTLNSFSMGTSVRFQAFVSPTHRLKIRVLHTQNDRCWYRPQQCCPPLVDTSIKFDCEAKGQSKTMRSTVIAKSESFHPSRSALIATRSHEGSCWFPPCHCSHRPCRDTQFQYRDTNRYKSIVV